MIKASNLDPSLRNTLYAASGLVPGMAEAIFICKSGGQALTYFGKQAGASVQNTLAAGLAAMTSGRNDCAILSPDAHSLGVGLDWNKNMCHLVGAFGPGRYAQRSRIGHSADFATLLTVSGYGNTFANIYLQHGRGNAANLNALTVSGNRNTFVNCHFGGPFHATEAGTASYTLVSLSGEEATFKDCIFGADSIASTTPVLMSLSGSAPRAIFENCLFLINGNTNTRFLKVVAGAGMGLGLFRNCQFVNLGTTQAFAIDGAGLNNYKLLFDQNCSFMGATDIVAEAYEPYVKFGTVTFPTGAMDDINTGLVMSPDMTT